MGNIFTRKAVGEIMGDEALTAEQKTEQVFALYGRALNDGYIAKAAARQAQEAALEQARAAWLESSMSRQAGTEWETGVKVPDPRESDAYRALQGEFDAYRAMQAARTSKDFESVKPKFFETVYGMVDRGEGAKPLREQLADIREQYEEYFTAEAGKPSAPFGGTSPSRGGLNGVVGGNPSGSAFGGIPAVVLPAGGGVSPGPRMTLAEAMRRANAGERVDVGMIGK